MEWAGLVDLSKFTVAAASYGGPIGMTQVTEMLALDMN